MPENRQQMYGGWNKSQTLSAKQIAKTKDFINRVISFSTIAKLWYLCNKCQNAKLFGKLTLSNTYFKMGLCQIMTWVFHGEKYTRVIAEEKGL